MEFIISPYKLDHIFKKPVYRHYNCHNKTLYIKDHFLSELELQNRNKLLIIGDCINSDILKFYPSFSPDLLKHLKGIFTLIVISENELSIYSSHFGMLPVYYTPDFSAISSSAQMIAIALNLKPSVNKRFILESFLFNYPFSDQCFLKGIIRMESFQYIKLKSELGKIHETENISEWFPDTPLNGKKHLKNLAEHFIHESKYYFGESKNTVTFTGGFDGRTIVSCGLYHQSDFETFCFGRPENKDVYIPQNNSHELKLPFHFYHLGEKDYFEDYLWYSQLMSKQTEGFNGFLYPHFMYGAVKESSRNDFLLTGYCGSELFRALHIQGAVTSKELVSIFSEKDDNKLKTLLSTSLKLSFLDFEFFRYEFDEMFEDIIVFRRQVNLFRTPNHFLYYYIFKEVFRKVFGSLVTTQFSNIIVRVPFLDFQFIKELLKIDLAGCNSEFFVHNPLKRLRGQLLYTEIIRQTDDRLFKLPTGKGYRPCDLMSFSGKMQIVFHYLKKKFTQKHTKPDLDNLGLISGYLKYRQEIEKTFQSLEGFRINELLKASENMTPYISESQRDMIFLAASLASITINT